VETGEHEYRTGDQVGGRYLLVARQGAGGMGTVWRAHDEKRGADVALKQLRVPRGADDGERRQRLTRFRREASTLARLARHPHIVNVHELIEAQCWTRCGRCTPRASSTATSSRTTCSSRPGATPYWWTSASRCTPTTRP
jgi:hypothetical protein